MIVEFWDDRFKKKKNSTKIPDFDGVKKEVVIKGNFGFENQFQSTKCSTIAPSFFVTGAAGYGYCKAWNNYYWITNVSFDIDGAEYITCELDVLASWRQYIAASTFFVDRCADPSYYNTDIFDEALSIEDGAEVASTARTQIWTDTSGSYLISVLGRSTTGLNTYVFSGPPPSSIFSPLFEVNTDGTAAFDSITDPIDAVWTFLKNLVMDPSKYIVAVKKSPIAANWYLGSSAQIYVGWWNSGVGAQRVPDSVYGPETVTLNKPSSIYSDFRRTDSRCSSYWIYFPGVGTVDLSPDIIELELTVDYSLDYVSGSIHYELKAGGSLVGSYDGCIYSDTGYGGASVNGGAIAQTAGGVAGAVGGMAKRDWVTHDNGISFDNEIVKEAKPLVIAAGVVAAIHGAGEAMKPQASLASPMGGCAAVRANPDIVIGCVQKHTAEFLTKDYGRPCCKNLQLGNLSGFVRCSNASIDIAAVKGVREEINNYLNTGFFME